MFHPTFRKKNNGAPILSKKEIDDIAESYVMDFCPTAVTNPQPLNVDLFIEDYLKLTLDYHFLSHDGRYLGMTVFNDTSRIVEYLPEKNCADYCSAGAGTIIIDSSLTEEYQINRYRYTGGHESGHWVLHRGYYNYDPNQLSFFDLDTPFVQCREQSRAYYSGNTRMWNDERWMEWQADKFASSFLMPKTAVQTLIDEKKKHWTNEANLITITSVTFRVSEEAARYRLMDLGYIESINYIDQLALV